MVFFFNVTATTEIYTYLHTLSLHDALPISFAREGYNAQLSIAYISLINTVNNIAERDQFLGRPIINVTDEGHIITKNPLLAPYVVKITKMWRQLGAWFWLATQNLDDLPKAAEPMLNMIRSEERRVGKESVSRCRSRWSPAP